MWISTAVSTSWPVPIKVTEIHGWCIHVSRSYISPCVHLFPLSLSFIGQSYVHLHWYLDRSLLKVMDHKVNVYVCLIPLLIHQRASRSSFYSILCTPPLFDPSTCVSLNSSQFFHPSHWAISSSSYYCFHIHDQPMIPTHNTYVITSQQV